MTLLRPLLPAVGHQRSLPPEEPPKKRKTAACESCRQHKSRCDGMPICAACVKRNSICRYNPTETRQIRKKHERLQQRQSMYEDLVELLRTRTEQDAAEVFLRLKAGADVESIVKYVRDGDLLMQLSLTPEISRQCEFPLVNKMPSHLFVAGNVYLDSLLYVSTFPPSISRRDGSTEDDEVQAVSKNDPARQDQHRLKSKKQRTTLDTNHHSAYELPYHTARMVEPIVEKITATPWTQVISDDRLFRRLICSYFCYPHPCGPFVHKGLFLEDMAADRTSFCSPLLVNAMLANACQSYLHIPDRSKVWLPDSLTYRFMAEARRLWDLESLPGKSKITTIQAALIMSYHTTNNGLDEIGAIYAKRAREMSEDLDLFGPDNRGRSTSMEKARVFTAWAVFSWQAMSDYYFFRQPHFSQPPQVPLPDPRLEPLWYGEIWVQYPRDQTIIPLHLGFKLHSEATLRILINEIGQLAFGRPSSRTFSVGAIAVLKRKLDHWKNTLPEPLQPEVVVFPSHLMLHVQYWQIVESIMQLIVNDQHLNAFQALHLCAGEPPLSALHEARVMLETVTCLYYARHDFATYDPWIAFALTIIGNTVINKLKTESALDPCTLTSYRSILILSAQGLAKQGLNYHNGMLLAGQLQGAMSSGNLQSVCTYVTAAGISESDKKMIALHSHSQWPIPGMVAINEDPERARLKRLIEALEERQE